MNALYGTAEESSVRLLCAYFIAVLMLTVLGGLMVDGVGRELTVGPQEEEDDDNDEEEDNDNDGNNNDDELDMMEQGIPIDAPIQPQPKKRNFYSRAHDDIVAGNIMYYHIDLEHTGTDVCQLSVVSMNDKFEPMTEWSRYIKPPPDAEWLEHSCNSHKLKPTPVIKGLKGQGWHYVLGRRPGRGDTKGYQPGAKKLLHSKSAR